jgi:uncharacterized protein
MSASRDARPVAGRLEFVDSLRGFALLGVFWANLLIFAGLEYMHADQRAALFGSPLDRLASLFERFFIENKFMGLFSFLFGISFWLFWDRAQRGGASAPRLFYRRIFWLFVIGAIHGWLFWCFDILRFYALWAVLLPLFLRTSPRRLLRIALATGVLVPALFTALDAALGKPPAAAIDFDAMALRAFSNGSYREVLTANWRYDWHLTNSVSQISYQVAIFGRLLLGLCVARAVDLGQLDRVRPLLRRVLIGGGLAGLVGSTIFAARLMPSGGNPVLSFIRHLVIEGGQLGLTLAYASALALAFLVPRWRRGIRLLAPIGQMALTWYLFQTAFGIWMFYGFAHGPALMGKLGPASLAALALVGFGVQVALARAWMSRFHFGPAEWCWRSLTYAAVQPFSKRPFAPEGDGPRRSVAAG